jgi:hypothetical protein
VLVVLLAVAVTIVYLVLRSAWRELVGHGLHRVAFRWLTGYAISGKHYTDATWFKRATRVYHPTRHVLYWHHLPRLHRMGYRWLITITLSGILYGLFTNHTFTLRLLSITILLFIMYMGWIARCRIVRWHRHRITVAPLADALASILGLPEVETERSIALAPDYMTRKRGKLGDISLPSHFRALPNERASIEHLINSRMPIECDFLWNTRRTPAVLTIIAAPNPPDITYFGEYMQQMEACKPGDVVIGLDRHRELFYGSFNLDDPHWGFSVASGRGKSTFLQVTCAQILHNNPLATVDAIDPKMTSLEPLIGIPGVRVACDPRNIGEMWELVDSVKAEMFD